MSLSPGSGLKGFRFWDPTLSVNPQPLQNPCEYNPYEILETILQLAYTHPYIIVSNTVVKLYPQFKAFLFLVPAPTQPEAVSTIQEVAYDLNRRSLAEFKDMCNICVCMYLSIYLAIYMFKDMYMHVCVCVCMYVCMHIYIYISICIQTYT